MKSKLIEIILFILLIIVSLTFAYYYGTQRGKDDNSSIPQTNISSKEPSPTPSSVPSPTPLPTIVQTKNIPSGWKTYTNEKFGFEISYPSAYKVLTDKNNLYGWPNGVVLIYKGGQSYDLVIEHWNTQTEYENKYKTQTNITAKKIDDFYITLLNNNSDPEIDKVIETFEVITLD